MSLFQHLRMTNRRDGALHRCAARYPQRQVVSPSQQARYLSLQLANASQQQTSAYIDIDTWLQSMDAHLPGIPWQQVPLSYLVRWLNSLQLSFFIEDEAWNVIQVSLLENVLPKKLLSLAAKPCGILSDSWPTGGDRQLKLSPVLLTLPFALRYQLGSSQMALSDLASIKPGDLLRIGIFAPGIYIGHYKLFNFKYLESNEVIVEESIMENQGIERREEAILLDWAMLPVDVEFVLDSTTLSLHEIDAIDVGTLLSLKPDIEKKVRVYLNRKLFAQGELVLLEEGGLAVEVNQIATDKDVMTGLADVE